MLMSNAENVMLSSDADKHCEQVVLTSGAIQQTQ